MPNLAEWESYYLIVGPSAAALIGLMFVVITLSAGRRSAADEAAFTAFATPTIVHLSLVLLIAAVASTPGHTIRSLRICVLLMAVGGIAYLTRGLITAVRQTAYRPVLSDWVGHFVLPFLSYGMLLAAGLILGRRPALALYLTAATALSLLYVAIRNAWDSAVWMTMKDGDPSSQNK
jgi:hypothetical protein